MDRFHIKLVVFVIGTDSHCLDRHTSLLWSLYSESVKFYSTEPSGQSQELGYTKILKQALAGLYFEFCYGSNRFRAVVSQSLPPQSNICGQGQEPTLRNAVRSSPRVGSSIACKGLTRVKVPDSGKPSSLVEYEIYNNHNFFELISIGLTIKILIGLPL